MNICIHMTINNLVFFSLSFNDFALAIPFDEMSKKTVISGTSISKKLYKLFNLRRFNKESKHFFFVNLHKHYEYIKIRAL